MIIEALDTMLLLPSLQVRTRIGTLLAQKLAQSTIPSYMQLLQCWHIVNNMAIVYLVNREGRNLRHNIVQL